MVMGDSDFYVHRRPAVRVGGQRQRNRLSRVPRSNTTPVLSPAANTGVTGPSDVSIDPNARAQEGAHQPQGMSTLNTSQSMMNFC
jgi:hypothetical protein